MGKKTIPKFMKIPNGDYIVKEKTYGDKYVQNKKTGKMKGRKSVKSKGDKTGVRRVEKPFILVKKSKNKRGHVRRINKKYKEGQILGKFSSL